MNKYLDPLDNDQRIRRPEEGCHHKGDDDNGQKLLGEDGCHHKGAGDEEQKLRGGGIDGTQKLRGGGIDGT